MQLERSHQHLLKPWRYARFILALLVASFLVAALGICPGVSNHQWHGC